MNISKGDLKTSLSHANVIVDITQKCLIEGVPPREMRALLRALATHAFARLSEFPGCAKHRPTGVSVDLITTALQTHESLGKTFNVDGNHCSLTFPELMASIRWIALQEDINYPLRRGLEGRKMPFARYHEATYCITGECTLEDVLRRALEHSRPPRLEGIDYGFLEDIH